MNFGEGIPCGFGFRLSVGIGVADEVTAGPGWLPGVIEGLTVDTDNPTVAVRGFVTGARLPLREGIAAGTPLPAAPVFVVGVDASASVFGDGYALEVNRPRWVPVNQVVPFAPWYLVVRVDNQGGAVATVSGWFSVRLLPGLTASRWAGSYHREPEAWALSRWREDVQVGVGSARVGQVVTAWR